MSSQKVRIDLDDVCDVESKGGFLSCGSVFSSRVDMLVSRADILNVKDRALMRMYLQNGVTFRQMAQVSGSNETLIARRIHKLTSKILDGEYITCLRNREQFKEIEMVVARDYFIEGVAQKRIAKNRGLTVYSTRKILHKIRKIASEV